VADRLGAAFRTRFRRPFEARFPVGEVQLVRSTLRPAGAMYDIVARQRLGGSAEPG
jgi:2'-5' RNA ligase